MSAISFETIKTEHYPSWGFRDKVPCFPMRMNFIFLNGGMGDYICWMPAIQWLASQATWIRGTLVCPVYFTELAEHWLRDFPSWQIKTYRQISEIPSVDSVPFRGPVLLQNENLNATGAHLLSCGWVYFTNKDRAPVGWENYPAFKQEHLDASLTDEHKALHNYAVITTGMTTNSRKVPGKSWNHVIEYVRDLGMTPVFLGKEVVETGNAANIHTKFDEALRIDLGVDLRNKTTLTQAAGIMSRARVVIGHDNGLLHLAGCTDVPIVFGYNLASPEHREPKRPVGNVFNVQLTHAELACNFCQSNTNFVIGYNFRECFYGDTKCIELLFEDGARRWKEQINRALEVGYGHR